MTATTDAERLLAAGHKAKLADGEHAVVFNFRALVVLEKRFGGLAEINRRLAFTGETAMADIAGFLAAGLAHEGLDEEVLEERILIAELVNYPAVINRAMTEAFPEARPGKGRGKAETASTGNSSTTSPPSATAEATTTSGG